VLSRCAVLEMASSILDMDVVIKVDIEILIGIPINLLKNVFKGYF